jgi:DNA-directed RNA polymerase subunit RPC12/RpoP
MKMAKKQEQTVICTACNKEFTGMAKSSPLGFDVFDCPHCRQKVFYPMPKSYVTGFIAALVIIGIFSVYVILQGRIPLQVYWLFSR